MTSTRASRGWTALMVAATLMLLATAISSPAQTFTTLYSFDTTDGSNPYAGLVQATNGYLYGTTSSGGSKGVGTIFAISLSGTLTKLYTFCSQGGCTDGEYPEAGLVQATNGDLYGTTYGGGAKGGAKGVGTIFEITPSGRLTTLYSFCSQSHCTDGSEPVAALIQATDGNFYGTTTHGGGGNRGTIFNITSTGLLTTLHSLDGREGYYPASALVQATDGAFYGTTPYGGDSGAGTFFTITPSGTVTLLHSFDGTDGSQPNGLVQATDGNLYGTTYGGGADGYGTIFKISPSGTLTTLYSFDITDGQYPVAALIQATDGNLYGTTYAGGANGYGTIFTITPTGTLTTLHSFDGTDGDDLVAGLVQDTNGILYGTTERGGATGEGTVFSLSVGLGPFVKTLPTSGKVGASVKILGTDLTGATSVTFNGTPATFVIGSANGIATTVPAGATTGTVQVVTPSGTFSSNVVFRVTP
ncbi:MAG TPA: choice-of-anchor tandem repeat GloVer-containing protein [Terriglobia bacterium]|nr:choice-of-anchor tandem repeat GloVer-containing protein [Terriglobia bacterium]